MQTPEGREKARVRSFLTEIGAFHRWPVPYGYGQPHVDCYACIMGIWWSIEVKKPGDEPTVLQWRTLRETLEAGGKIAWGTAADIIPVIERWRHQLGCGGPFPRTIDTDPHAQVPPIATPRTRRRESRPSRAASR